MLNINEHVPPQRTMDFFSSFFYFHFLIILFWFCAHVYLYSSNGTPMHCVQIIRINVRRRRMKFISFRVFRSSAVCCFNGKNDSVWPSVCNRIKMFFVEEKLIYFSISLALNLFELISIWTLLY